MNFYLVKFTKEDVPVGRAYTYKSQKEFSVGDKVVTPNGKHAVVVDGDIDYEFIDRFGEENIKEIKESEVE